MRSFGAHDDTNDVEPVPFELKYRTVGGEKLTFTGQVVPRPSGGDFAKILTSLKNKSETVVSDLQRLLSKQMDDTDGAVNSRWAGDELPVPEDLDPEELEELEPLYTGPDGGVYAFSDTDTWMKWQDQSTWTTRRRWRYLMEEDDEALVNMTDLVDMMKWAIGLAGKGRPTKPRA